MIGFRAAGEHHAGFLERLGDVDERNALFQAARAEGIQSTITSAPPPATPAAARCRAARLDRHVEAGLLVEAFVLGDVVACELRLGDPFELDGHLVRLREGGARKAQSDGARE